MKNKLLTLISAAAVLGGSNASAVDFEKEILPIFKERCFDCHQKERTDEKTGKVKKPKGKFRMDSAALLLKGGSEGSNIVPGDAAKSTVYTSVTLPETDELAMPPEGKGDRLTKAQQDLIKAWITEGAKFGTWKGEAE
jgi:hypothetical protein